MKEEKTSVWDAQQVMHPKAETTEDGTLVAWMLPESTLAKLRAFSAEKQTPQYAIVTEAIEHYMALKKR